jgi:hypothetical protein
MRYGLELVLLTIGAPGGQTATATTIENFPGFPDGITGAELIMRLTQQAENFGVTFQNAEVKSIEPEGERWRLICGDCEMIDLDDEARRTTFPRGTHGVDLLVPVFRSGRRVCDPPSIEDARRRTQDGLAQLRPEVKRLVDPDQYPVGLEIGLHQRRTDAIRNNQGPES